RARDDGRRGVDAADGRRDADRGRAVEGEDDGVRGGEGAVVGRRDGRVGAVAEARGSAAEGAVRRRVVDADGGDADGDRDRDPGLDGAVEGGQGGEAEAVARVDDLDRRARVHLEGDAGAGRVAEQVL